MEICSSEIAQTPLHPTPPHPMLGPSAEWRGGGGHGGLGLRIPYEYISILDMGYLFCQFSMLDLGYNIRYRIVFNSC